MINRTRWPTLFRAMQRRRLLKAETYLLQAMRDDLSQGQDVSPHDSELLELANRTRDLREGHYP